MLFFIWSSVSKECAVRICYLRESRHCLSKEVWRRLPSWKEDSTYVDSHCLYNEWLEIGGGGGILLGL